MADDITRRDFLAGVAATVGVTAPLASDRQQKAPPRHPPSSSSPPPPGSSGKAILGQDDLKYAGLFALPTGQQLGFSNGALTGRRAGGEVRLFVCGGYPSGDPVIEVAYTGAQGRDLLQAPRARLVRNWGDVYSDKRVTATGGGRVTRGLLWANDQLYWSYGDAYNVAGAHDPSIGTTVLNTNGTTTTHGPWRTEEHSQKTRGYMVQIPQWFQQYTDGRGFAVGAPITSGNGSSPWGAMLDAISFPENRTPADKINEGHNSIKCQRLIYHDIEHKQKRDGNYKYCGWKVQYDCSKGSFLEPGAPAFNGIDMMTAAAWIDLPNKHGVVFFGQLSTAIPGYNYGGNDTQPHYWYGPTKCCHGQNGEPLAQSTGDATSTSVPYAWIYDPADLARAAQRKVDPWKLEPVATFPLYSISNTLDRRAGALYLFGGAYFDAESRSLFVSQIYYDSIAPEPQPAVHVFTIA